jgi:hypothetical protein
VKTVADPRVVDGLGRRLERLTPATPRRWGTLCAHEMLCHLADASASGHFGAMIPRDWQRWGYRHTDHHLRQFGL